LEQTTQDKHGAMLMTFKILRKDFLPIAAYDRTQYREYTMKYSYTGREFDSIVGYLITNGIDEFWATEEDILELFPNVDLEHIPDATGLDSVQQVINIFNSLLSVDEDIDIAIQRVQKYINHPIVNDYILKIKNQYFD
jgi:hypothetical protein